jgi:hypothetical protein
MEEIMPRRNFHAAVVALALLALSGSAAQAATPRGPAASASLARIFAGLVPHPLWSWLDGTATAWRERPRHAKCSAGIDPNGKPCP